MPDTESYRPADDRYSRCSPAWFRRCGRSGLKLPAISLGCWHNFGGPGTDAARHADESSLHDSARRMLFTAFDCGVTHFDLANNYGPPPGSAEERVGRILKQDLARYRDELVISTKAGYEMWPGPYGDRGSRKYLLASLDASLKRLGLDYVDVFYHHRPDPETPVEESMAALDQAVRSGKATYAAISNYRGAQTAEALLACDHNHLTKPILHQPSYSMLNRWPEPDLFPVTDKFGLGVIVFSPLAQGQLSDKYLHGIPADSRAGVPTGFLKAKNITPETVAKVSNLNAVARRRGQSLAQMALAWTLRAPSVTSALIGASRPEQIRENCAAFDAAPFTPEELKEIDAILAA